MATECRTFMLKGIDTKKFVSYDLLIFCCYSTILLYNLLFIVRSGVNGNSIIVLKTDEKWWIR